MDWRQRSKILENISSHGRMAYGICALENYVLAQGDPPEQWKVVFKQLWSFPEHDEEWFYKTPEYFPSSILEFREYLDAPWDYLDEISFKKLYDLYSHTPRIYEIDNLMEWIHRILGVEMHGASSDESAIAAMDAFLHRAQSYQINMPDISLFTRFTYQPGVRLGKNILRSEIPIPYRFD